MHFLSDHLPSSIYNSCELIMSTSHETPGRKDWRQTITKKDLRALSSSKSDWATAARKLLDSQFDAFDRNSIAALYTDNFREDIDFASLMVDFQTSYLITRLVRAVLKTLWDPDVHGDVLTEFKDLLQCVTFEGGEELASRGIPH